MPLLCYGCDRRSGLVLIVRFEGMGRRPIGQLRRNEVLALVAVVVVVDVVVVEVDVGVDYGLIEEVGVENGMNDYVLIGEVGGEVVGSVLIEEVVEIGIVVIVVVSVQEVVVGYILTGRRDMSVDSVVGVVKGSSLLDWPYCGDKVVLAVRIGTGLPEVTIGLWDVVLGIEIDNEVVGSSEIHWLVEVEVSHLENYLVGEILTVEVGLLLTSTYQVAHILVRV